MRPFHTKRFTDRSKKKDRNGNLIRSFFAIDFDSDIQSVLNIIQKAVDPLFKGIRVTWVRPEQMHLTLRFLGEIDENSVKTIISRCDFIQQEPWQNIQIRDLGCFPSKRNPRVIWVGCDCPEAIYRIQAKIEAVAQSIGLEAENRLFTPHLTLGRIRETKSFAIDLPPLNEFIPDIQLPGQIVRNIRLYRSRLTPEGPQYSVIHEFPMTEK